MLRKLGFLFGLFLSLLMPSDAFSECSRPPGKACLDFSSLPSAQGWHYLSPTGSDLLEEDVFFVDGARLTQDTMGLGSETAFYITRTLLDPLIPFTVSVRARVLQSETTMPGGVATAFGVSVFTGEHNFSFTMNSDTINVGGMKFPFDNREFHEYRYEVIPRVGYALFVDDSLLVTGVPAANPGGNTAWFGNGSAFENGLVEVEKLCIAQGIAMEIVIRADGSDKINRRSSGKIPVAVLTTEKFDVALIDSASMRFGPNRAMEVHGGGHFEDVDGDGDVDLTLHFANRDTGITCDDSSVSLTGRTVSGIHIQGCQDIQPPECRLD